MFAKGDDDGFFLDAENRRAGSLRTGLAIFNGGTLAPLAHCLGIDPAGLAQLFDRSLRSLLCRSDRVRRRGAAV